MLRYHQLTPEQQEAITNGCGPKGGWLDPPDWFFEASCDWHDFAYWRGGTEDDRLKADWGFYQAMIRDTRRAPWYLRPTLRFQAWLYYTAVRLFARSQFHYGEMRGLDDLREE